MDRKYKVSKSWLDELFICLDEGCTDVPEDILALNLAKVEDMEKFVDEFIMPIYLERSRAEQFYIKESLRYGLNFWSEYEFSMTFDCLSLIVQIPNNKSLKEFSLDVWNLMFNNEDYKIPYKSKYIEVSRIMQI